MIGTSNLDTANDHCFLGGNPHPIPSMVYPHG